MTNDTALILLGGLAFVLLLALYWMALQQIDRFRIGAAQDAETIIFQQAEILRLRGLIKPFDHDNDGKPGG